MKSGFNILGLAVLGVVALSPIVFAQSPAGDTDSTRLIAWTEMQRPEPMQSDRQYPQQTQPDNRTQPGEGEQGEMQQEPAAQAFAGTIEKDGNQCVLKTTDGMTYKLDDQKRAKKYEGKQVQVMGVLNTRTNLIQVQQIKPAS